MATYQMSIDPAWIQDFMTVGWETGRKDIVTCTKGLPEDAVFMRSWYEPQPMPSGRIVMLFSDGKPEDICEGAHKESLMPEYVTEHRGES